MIKKTLHYSYLAKEKNTPILYLHGFMGARSDWVETTSIVETFSSVTVDLPGHGASPLPKSEFSMEETAKQIIFLLDHLEIKKCFLVGYSLGGRLALYLLLHFPARFVKVVIESSTAGLKTKEERLQRQKSDLQLAMELETKEFSLFIDTWYNLPLFASLKKHPKFENMRQMRLQNKPKNLAIILRSLGTGFQPSLWGKLVENKVPVLYITGEYDHKYQNIGRQMIATNSNIQMQIVAKSGHNVHLENVKGFVHCIVDFFEEKL